jgi:hypothetical protein
MNFTDYRKSRSSALKRRQDCRVERRPSLTTQEERFLYSLRLKTMEYRTLMATLKQVLPPSKVDEVIVEYSMRLRKARKNFESNNYDFGEDEE